MPDPVPDPIIVSTPGLSLSISALENAVVVQCRGTLIYERCDFVKREVKSRITDKGRVILDLSEVTRMDSSGLGTVVGAPPEAEAAISN